MSNTSTRALKRASTSVSRDESAVSMGTPAVAGPFVGHALSRVSVLPARPGAVQTALMVGSADNALEREADTVAAQVMGTPDSAIAAAPAPANAAVAREAEEEELQAKRAPVAISREAEEEELQAKRVETPAIAREAEEEELQAKRVEAPTIAREAEEEELQAKRAPSIARSGEDMSGSFEAGGEVEGGISAKKGGGSALGPEVRSFMEPRFGADFSNVRVHSDAQSDGLNRQIGARAFATGSDVFFRKGEYEPNSSAGRSLLAHELTHVVQQGGAPSLQTKRRKN
jgi:hypothetical protein